LPRPRELSTLAGSLSLPKKITVRAITPPHTMAGAIARLVTGLRDLGHAPEVAGGLPPTDEDAAVIRLEICPPLLAHPEGYRLQIGSRGVSVIGADAAGLFYGVCTLLQLIRLHAPESGTGSVTLPWLRVTDWPDFRHRGVMLDVSRDKVPTMATLRELVDLFAGWKINQLQLYVEHTFAYRGHEAVWKNASPLTAEEIVELDAYCYERHIELVPNQNSFGHMQRWVCFEPYRRLAEAPDGFDHPWNPTREPYGLCPIDPASLTFLEDLYDQLLPNFRSRQLNVGLDETIDLGLGRSKDACKEKGTERVYLEFLQKIHRLVAERGHIMQFWGDIIMHRPELIAELPEDAVALEWGYEASHPFADHTAKFAASGLTFYVCPGTSSWNTIAGRTKNAVGNLKSAALNGHNAGAIGYLNTDWGDNGHLQPLPVSYLGFLLGAGFSWNQASANDTGESDIVALLNAHVFRDKEGIMGRLAYDLGNAYLCTGAEPHNSSPLFTILAKSEQLWGGAPSEDLKAVTADRLRETLAYIDKVTSRLSDARMDRTDAALVLEEFRWAADTLRFACRFGIEQFAAGGQVALIPETTRSRLAAELSGITDRHRKIWLSRNRPGGLDDSARRLERTLASLSAKSEEHKS
jgi:hypothetical protein